MLTLVLLWFAAVSAGVMAGIYFTFSVFAVRALADLGGEPGARAMQSINRVIVRTAFLPLFFASTAASAALVVIGVIAQDAASAPMIAGGAIYVLGMFVVSVAGNVPLNNRLEASDPASADGQAVWREYRRRWTRLNHIRVLASVMALALFVMALAASQQPGGGETDDGKEQAA